MRPLHELILEAARQTSGSTSRRRVLTLTGAAAASPAIAGLESALAKKKKKNKNRGRRNNPGNAGGAGDTAILNYALTLEHLENAFYRDGLAQFSAGDFDPGVFAFLQQIGDHEQTHVDVLTDIIEDRNGDPVEEQCYNFDALQDNGDFDFQDPDGFLQIARLLEDTGVMAYTGAIADIKSGDLQEAGATIATVEARHASYIRLIVLNDPFPAAFDEPKTMEEILAAAGGFIEGPMPCDDGNGE